MPEIVAIEDDTADLEALLAKDVSGLVAGEQSNPEDAAKTATDAEAAALAEANVLAEQEAAAAAAAAEEAAAEAQRVKDEAGEGRKRIYTGHLPPERQREIAIAANNPDMPLEQVRELAAQGNEELEGAAPVTARAELEAAKARYAELDKDLIQCDKDFVRPVGEKPEDFDWDRAVTERSALLLKITELAPVVAQEDLNANSYDSTWSQAEAEAAKLLPGVDDESTDAYAACAGRTAQIVALESANKPLPKVVIDGRSHVMDPSNPNFPYLVAHEQAQKLGIVKASEAKPDAPEAKPPVKRLSPVPGGQTQSVTKLAPVEGQRTKLTLQERASGMKTMADLDKFLAEPDDDSQGFAFDGRRQFVID